MYSMNEAYGFIYLGDLPTLAESKKGL